MTLWEAEDGVGERRARAASSAVALDATLEHEGLTEFCKEVGWVVVGVDMADVEDDGADSFFLNLIVAYMGSV